MEMSALSAKNVVNMALHDWKESINMSKRNWRGQGSNLENFSNLEIKKSYKVISLVLCAFIINEFNEYGDGEMPTVILLKW